MNNQLYKYMQFNARKRESEYVSKHCNKFSFPKFFAYSAFDKAYKKRENRDQNREKLHVRT